VKIHVLVAKKTNLKMRMNCEDQHFVDFVRWLLEIDPLKRPSAKEALSHPWLTEQTYINVE
jgi:serine/threonine protein kinase